MTKQRSQSTTYTYDRSWLFQLLRLTPVWTLQPTQYQVNKHHQLQVNRSISLFCSVFSFLKADTFVKFRVRQKPELPRLPGYLQAYDFYLRRSYSDYSPPALSKTNDCCHRLSSRWHLEVVSSRDESSEWSECENRTTRDSSSVLSTSQACLVKVQ